MPEDSASITMLDSLKPFWLCGQKHRVRADVLNEGENLRLLMEISKRGDERLSQTGTPRVGDEIVSIVRY